MEYEDPVISIAIEPKTHSDQEKIDEVLEKFLIEDPTLKVSRDEETGQTILSGMGELHLEIIISRMVKEFNTSVNVGKPQVVYREIVTAPSRGQAVFDREIQGRHHYADVTVELNPLDRGAGVSFKSLVDEVQVPAATQAAMEQGIRESLDGGYLKRVSPGGC